VAAKGAVALIDRQSEKTHTQKDAIKDLHQSIEAIKLDIAMYQALLESMLKDADTKPMERLCNR
jgi:hypothetical protein